MSLVKSRAQNAQRSATLVEVVLRWSGDVVEVRHLDDFDTHLTVGHGVDDDLFIPSPTVELLRRIEAGWIVRPLDGDAPVVLGDVELTFASGPFTIEVRVVDRASAVCLVPLFDNLWANTATVTMFAMGALVAIAVLSPSSIENDVDALKNMPPKFTTMLSVKPPQKKEPVASPEKSEDAASDVATAPNSTKRPKPPAAPKRTKESDRDVVDAKLASLFGKGGALASLVGDTGTADMNVALGGIRSGKATAALGLRPGIPGATGTATVGIGGIRRGTADNESYGSYSGLLCDDGKLNCREDREVGVVAELEPPNVVGYDKEIIRRIVREHMSQVRACYERELQSDRGLGGKVSAKWVIAPDGKVSQSSASTSDPDMQPVAVCIAKNVRTWRFPMPKGGGNVVVNYPFVLKASGR